MVDPDAVDVEEDVDEDDDVDEDVELLLLDVVLEGLVHVTWKLVPSEVLSADGTARSAPLTVTIVITFVAAPNDPIEPVAPFIVAKSVEATPVK